VSHSDEGKKIIVRTTIRYTGSSTSEDSDKEDLPEIKTPKKKEKIYIISYKGEWQGRNFFFSQVQGLLSSEEGRRFI